METNKRTIYIVFNSQVSGNSMGGGDKIVLNISNQLAINYKHTICYVGCPEGCEMLHANFPNISFKHLNKFGVGKTWFVLTYFARILVSFTIFFIGIEKNDYVLSASDFLPDTVPCFLFRLFNKNSNWIANMFLRARNPFKREINFNISTFFYFVSQKLSILLFKKADVVFVLCDEDKTYLISCGIDRNKIHVISGGVSTAEFDRVPSPQSKEYEACFVGRFHYQKGIEDLIHVWGRVVSQIPSARLAIIGWGNNGNERDAIKDLLGQYNLAHNIDLLGFIDGDAKIKLMKSSRLLLFPSSFESWGVTVAEGICCHIPVVAYSLPILKRNFDKGVVWVPQFSTTKFYEKVLELLTDSHLYERVIVDAGDYYKSLDWMYASEKVARILREHETL